MFNFCRRVLNNIFNRYWAAGTEVVKFMIFMFASQPRVVANKRYFLLSRVDGVVSWELSADKQSFALIMSSYQQNIFLTFTLIYNRIFLVFLLRPTLLNREYYVNLLD